MRVSRVPSMRRRYFSGARSASSLPWVVFAIFALVSDEVQGTAQNFSKDHGKDNLHMDVGPHLSVTKAHLIFMTHFDVGYTVPTVRETLDLYRTQYFPSSFNTSKVLRERGGEEQFRWTSHAWLIDQLLTPFVSDTEGNITKTDSSKDSFQSRLIEAIGRDDIVWHANPMNMQGEVGSANHMNFGQGFAHRRLDDRFGKPHKRAASQKDVPGMSLGMIPIMAKHGVTFIHIGVNDMSTPPAFPHNSPPSQGLCNVAYWELNPMGSQQRGARRIQRDLLAKNDSDDNKILISYCSGYNAPVTSTIVDGFDEALVFLMKIDNRGPHTAEEVIEVWNTTQHIYPNAQLVVSSMEEWYDALQQRLNLEKLDNSAAKASPSKPQKIEIPSVQNVEFGDTWVYGTSSDPTKMRWYRAIMREIDTIMDRTFDNEERDQFGQSTLLDESPNTKNMSLRREAVPAELRSLQHSNARVPFCNTTSPDFINFLSMLLKIPEHTWGHNGSPCNQNFTNYEWKDPGFECVQNGTAYHTVRGSWLDQRNYIRRALDQLDHRLHGDLRTRLIQAIRDREPEPEREVLENIEQMINEENGYEPIDSFKGASRSYLLGDDGENEVKLQLNASGAVTFLQIGNVTICTPSSTSPDRKDHALGVLTYRTHSERELNSFGDTYCENKFNNCGSSCGRCGFGKCRMDCRYHNGADSCGLSRSTSTPATIRQGYSRKLNSTVEEFWFVAAFDKLDRSVKIAYGPPKLVVTKFVVDVSNVGLNHGRLVLHYDVTWYRKPETRMAESLWFSFSALVGEDKSNLQEENGNKSKGSSRWRMHKLGQWIDPLNVAVNGSQAIHNIWDGIELKRENDDKASSKISSYNMKILSPDAPVVSPNLDLMPTGVFNQASAARPDDGWAFSLFNNAWDTNYPLWSLEQEERFQFTVTIGV